jgi:hypothetical protein
MDTKAMKLVSPLVSFFMKKSSEKTMGILESVSQVGVLKSTLKLRVEKMMYHGFALIVLN